MSHHLENERCHRLSHQVITRERAKKKTLDCSWKGGMHSNAINALWMPHCCRLASKEVGVSMFIFFYNMSKNLQC